MATLRYTTEELIESLKRTRFKTIVVEGGDDIEILRDIESKLSLHCGSVNFVHAGDKTSVLRIWEEKESFPHETIGFLADSDLWLFNSERKNYPKVVFTHGYSIENVCIQSPSVTDFAGARIPTQTSWTAAIVSLIDWFSAEAAFHLDGQNPIFNVGVGQIFDCNAGFALTQMSKDRIAAAPPLYFAYIRNIVITDPLRFIRGKQLF